MLQKMVTPIFRLLPRLLFVTGFCLAAFCSRSQTTPKIGYADFDYIFTQLPDSKQIDASLKTISDQLNTLITTKDQEMKKKFTDYVAAEKTMPENLRANMLTEVEQLQDNLEKLKQDAQSELQRKQQQLLFPVYDKIKKGVADVAKENGYTLILAPVVSGVTALVYKEEKDNISELVLKKLGVTPQPIKADKPIK
jgi:outer membrane protein